jgi:hypothetical protein
LATDGTIDETAPTSAIDDAATLDDATAARHGHAGDPAGNALDGGSAARGEADAGTTAAQAPTADADAADGDAELRLGRPAVGRDQHGRGGEHSEEPGKDAAGRAERSIV